MTDTENKNMEQDQKNKRNRIYLILFAFFALLSAVLIIFLLTTKKNLKELTAEKEKMKIELQGELDSLMVEHEHVKTEYGALSDSLNQKDSLIQVNAKEIKRLLNTQWEYYKIKKKMSRLREIAQGYVHQIDSLFQVNEALVLENKEIKERIQKVNIEKRQLEEVKNDLKQKVSDAAVLKAYNINAKTYRFKSNTDEKETDKARRVDKVKICFTLAENSLVPAGSKTIYIRIAQPDKMILSKGKGDNYSFDFQGERLQFSSIIDVEYLNKAEELCAQWYKNESFELIPGTYNVNLFTEDYEIGQTSFTLR